MFLGKHEYLPTYLHQRMKFYINDNQSMNAPIQEGNTQETWLR